MRSGIFFGITTLALMTFIIFGALTKSEAAGPNPLGDTGVGYQIIDQAEGAMNTTIGFELPRTLLATDRDVVVSQRNYHNLKGKVPETTHAFAKFLYNDPRVKAFGISFREMSITLYSDTDTQKFLDDLTGHVKDWQKKVK